MPVTPPATIITIHASATYNGGQTTTAKTLLVVVKVHKFAYAPSAASINTYKGCMVSFVFGGERGFAQGRASIQGRRYLHAGGLVMWTTANAESGSG
jgi:hypothetical protein